MSCEKNQVKNFVYSESDSTKIRKMYLKNPPVIKHLQNVDFFLDNKTIEYLHFIDMSSDYRIIKKRVEQKPIMYYLFKKYNININSQYPPWTSSYYRSPKGILVYEQIYRLDNFEKNYNYGNEIFVIFTVKKDTIKDVLILNLYKDKLNKYPLESEINRFLTKQEDKYINNSDSINNYTLLPICYYHYQKIIKDNNKDFFYSKFRIKNLYYKVYPNGNISTKIYEFP